MCTSQAFSLNWNINSFKPNNVFAKGVKVVDNYQVGDELSKKYKEAKKYADRLWENIQKEDE